MNRERLCGNGDGAVLIRRRHSLFAFIRLFDRRDVFQLFLFDRLFDDERGVRRKFARCKGCREHPIQPPHAFIHQFGNSGTGPDTQCNLAQWLGIRTIKGREMPQNRTTGIRALQPDLRDDKVGSAILIEQHPPPTATGTLCLRSREKQRISTATGWTDIVDCAVRRAESCPCLLPFRARLETLRQTTAVLDRHDQKRCRTTDIARHAEKFGRSDTIKQNTQSRDVAVRADLFVLDDDSRHNRIKGAVAQVWRAGAMGFFPQLLPAKPLRFSPAAKTRSVRIFCCDINNYAADFKVARAINWRHATFAAFKLSIDGDAGGPCQQGSGEREGAEMASLELHARLLASWAWNSKCDIASSREMDSKHTSPEPYTYAKAGVSIAAGNALVRAIAPLAKATRRPGADADLGGFGGFFDLKAAGFNDPLLVAANDGVGTKLKLAIESGKHDGVGIDLVAMCVNDLIVQGAEPLFFLDYYASGKLELATAERVVASIAEGCKLAGCALIGGETAEMPGMYADDDYDLAGFCVGAVERSQVLTADKVAAGDVILGLASSGVHSNGFSLVRRLAADKGWKLDRPALFDPEILLIDALMAPTRIYVKQLLPLVRAGDIHAMAHITGGGLLENIPRVMPEGLHAHVDADLWPQPRLMAFLQAQGNIEPEEMARTFNCGIGMAIVVAAEKADAVTSALEASGETVARIGVISEGQKGCTVKGSAETWSAMADWSATYHG